MIELSRRELLLGFSMLAVGRAPERKRAYSFPKPARAIDGVYGRVFVPPASRILSGYAEPRSREHSTSREVPFPKGAGALVLATYGSGGGGMMRVKCIPANGSGPFFE